MTVEIVYYRSQGWFVRTVVNKQTIAYGFDTKAEAEEFCKEQRYSVAE